MGMAKLHPEINYIGIEKYSSVLLRAIQKMEEEELPNVRFIRMDAEDINEVFGKDEVDKIYLNFSDPWPKDRHAKRRLPSRQFLARYDQLLVRDGRIEFKTDNRDLFEFALEELEPERAADIIRAYGTKNVIFGSDYPMYSPADALNCFMRLPLTDQERADILWNNAARVIGL